MNIKVGFEENKKNIDLKFGSNFEGIAGALLNSKVDKSQGAENAGKVLGIGNDGIVTPTDMPQNQKQADYLQNDEAATDYIKNRPFYTGNAIETEKFAESAITFQDAGGIYINDETVEIPKLVVGGIYFVEFDGTKYESIAVNVDVGIEQAKIIITGNASMYDSSLDDTGEPFFILNEEVEGEGEYNVIASQSAGEHIVRIVEQTAEIKKIDTRYLPDTIPYMRDGKIPKNYITPQFQEISEIFGSYITAGGVMSTLANPRPNKITLQNITLEEFNAMLDGSIEIPRLALCNGNIADIQVLQDYIRVKYVDYNTFHKQGYTDIAGANITIFDVHICEDPNNPGEIVSMYALIKLATANLT